MVSHGSWKVKTLVARFSTGDHEWCDERRHVRGLFANPIGALSATQGIVIMENLPDQKVRGARQAFENAAARAKEEFDSAIAIAINLVTQQSAYEYVTACGYRTDTV